MNVALLACDSVVKAAPLEPGPGIVLAEPQARQHQDLSTPCKPGFARKTAAGAPLLFTSLLVLPGPAAAELHWHWDQALRAGAAHAAAVADASSLWASCITPLVTDITYLLASCNAAVAQRSLTAGVTSSLKDADCNTAVRCGTGGTVVLPEGLRAVLTQLLKYLAACGMWATMQLLVECTSKAFSRNGVVA